VKIPMIMLVAGAAIAVTAPLANAAATKKHNTAPVHKVVKHAKPTKHVRITKPSGNPGGIPKPVTPRPPLYIYVPGYSGPALAQDPVDECESSGVNCTDSQLCQYWGENCSTAIAPSSDTIAPSSDQTADSTGDQSGDTQPAATVSTSEAQSSSSDQSAASSGDAQSASDMATDDSSDDC